MDTTITILNHLLLAAGFTAFFVLLGILCHRGAKRYEGCCGYAEVFCGVIFVICTLATLTAGVGGFAILLATYLDNVHPFNPKPMAVYDSIAAWFAILPIVYFLDRARLDWSQVWGDRKKCTLNVVVYMLYVITLLYAQVIAVITV